MNVTLALDLDTVHSLKLCTKLALNIDCLLLNLLKLISDFKKSMLADLNSLKQVLREVSKGITKAAD